MPGLPRPAKIAAGQIWSLPFPFDSTEEFKRRPALIVAVSPYGNNEDHVAWLCMITSQLRHATGGDVQLPQSSRRALTEDALMRTRRVIFQPLANFQNAQRAWFMGVIEPHLMDEVSRQLARMFR